MKSMKLTACLLLLTSCVALAATEEQLNKKFNVAPGGMLVVDVDFGSIAIQTNTVDGEVAVDVWRRVGRRNEATEQKFLREYPVRFVQDGATVTVRAEHTEVFDWFWSLWNRNEAKYTIRVPARFNVQLKTSGGGISVDGVAGKVTARTSGGGLSFRRVHGPLDGHTSGGGIDVTDCDGEIKIHTSGGGINLTGGSGTLDGHTSGGPVNVRQFHGDTRVHTSGGGITVENVTGEIEGTTSGGGIAAILPAPLLHAVNLSTSGGGVTVRIPESAAFELDAETSGGGVSSELPVTVVGKMDRGRLKGAVNSGGKSVRLRSSGGRISIRKL